MYCGDETGAFIGDVGSKTSRFGYGGEDCPKVVIPSAAYKSISTDGNINTVKGRKYKYSAPVSLMRIPPDNCFSTNDTDSDVGFVPIYSSKNSNDHHQHNISNNIGMIQDIDAWGSLWEYSYSALCVRGKGKHTKGYQFNNEQDLQPQGASKSSSQTISTQSINNIDVPIDHPLLAVDSTSRTIPTKEQEKQRSQMLEVLFESLSAPASYIAPTSMLSSFAYGRQTALVVDIGHSGSSVTPVVDGYCLSNGSVRSGRGGKWLGDVQQSVLEGGWDVNGSVINKWNGWGDSSDEGKAGVPPCLNGGVVPRYLLRSATPQNKLQLLKQSSFHSMATQEVMYEMMTSSHILPLVTNNKKESAIPFCGYGEGGDSMAVDIDVDNMAEEKKDEDGDESTGCYILPDGTKVDLAKSKAGQDLCRLPVSSCYVCFSLNTVHISYTSLYFSLDTLGITLFRDFAFIHTASRD